MCETFGDHEGNISMEDGLSRDQLLLCCFADDVVYIEEEKADFLVDALIQRPRDTK